MAKHRFIAGAVCPSCGEIDALKLIVTEQEGEAQESVECVSCDYHAERPKSQSAESVNPALIASFKP